MNRLDATQALTKLLAPKNINPAKLEEDVISCSSDDRERIVDIVAYEFGLDTA